MISLGKGEEFLLALSYIHAYFSQTCILDIYPEVLPQCSARTSFLLAHNGKNNSLIVKELQYSHNPHGTLGTCGGGSSPVRPVYMPVTPVLTECHVSPTPATPQFAGLVQHSFYSNTFRRCWKAVRLFHLKRRRMEQGDWISQLERILQTSFFTTLPHCFCVSKQAIGKTAASLKSVEALPLS